MIAVYSHINYKYIKTVTAVQKSDPVSSCMHSWRAGGTY